MATVINDRDNLLLAAPSRVLWTGVRGIKITSDYASFTVTDGVSAFPTITFTSTLNGVNGTVNWSVLTGTATITPPATGTTATLDYVNMTSDIITVKAEVIDGGITYSDTISITKVSNGLAPKYLVITAPAQMFTRADEYTAFTPAGITLTATPYGGVAAGAYTWRYWTGSAWSSPIGGATGATLALTSSSFATETRTYQATVTIGSTVVTDEYTVVRLTGGTDGFVGFLTNESVSMATDAAGTTPANIATLTAGTFKVFYGAVDVTGACTFSKVDTNCTTSITNFTGAYSASAMSADNAYSDFTATHTGIGFTMTKRLSLAKSRTGVTGTTGTSTYTATVYYRGATTPTATASTGSYNFATGVLTPPSGNVTWLTTQPATTTDNTWACNFTFTGTTASGTITAGTWSTPRVEAVNGSNGTNGEYRDVIQLYSSSSTIPTSANYNFSTNTVNTIVGGSGWSLVRPAASTSPTYMTTCLAKTTTPLVDVALTAWTTAVVVQQNGTNGSNGVNAKSLSLSVDSQVFQIAKSGLVNGVAAGSALVTFTSTGSNLTGSPALAFNVISGTATLSGSGSTRTMSYNSMTTDTVIVEVTGDGLSDKMTIVKVREGVDALTSYLTNESVNLPASDLGVVSSYTGASGVFKVYYGSADVTASSSFSIIANTDSLTSTIGASTGVYSVTAGFPSGNNTTSITYRATYTNVFGQTFTVDKVFSLAKAKAGSTGSTGAAAKALAINVDSQLFQISKTNTVSPSSIAISRTASNLASSPSYSVTSGTATLTGTGDTRTLTFANLTSDTATIQVSQDGLTDFVTVIKVREGVDSIASYLTNESVTLQADNAGVVSAYTGANGDFKVYYGAADVTNSCTFSIQSNPNTLTSTIGNTAGVNKGVYSVTGGFTADVASITYRATYTNAFGSVFTVDKVFSLAKSKTGGVGGTGSRSAIVRLYKWSWSDPSASLPTGTTVYTWATGGVVHPKPATTESNGWTSTIPTDGGAGKTLYQIEKAVVDATGIATSSDITWASGATITNLSKNGVGKFTCYSKFTGNGATPSGSVDVAVGSYPTSTAFGVTWLAAFTATPPALTTGQTLWVCDGYTNTAGTVTWLAPYLSSFKVGSLSAFTADLGTITAGNITLDTAGFIRGGQTAYNTGTGFWLGYSGGTYKFSIGSATKSLTWDGTDLSLTGDVITSGKVISTNGTGTVVVNGTTYTSSIIGVASTNNGVTGKTTSGFGVLGESASSTGVRAMSGTGSAIEASCYSESANPVISVLVSGTTSRRGIDISVGNAGQTGIRSVIPTGGSGFSAEFTGGVKLNTGSPITTGGGTGNIGSVLTSNGSSSSPSWGKKIDGGSGTADASGNLAITFSVTFSNTNYGLSGAGTSGQYFVIVSKSTTGCVVQVQDYNTAAPVPSAGISWTAIGS